VTTEPAPATGAGRRDIVVMGASAGGVEALSRTIAGLPSDFPAAVFVVLHVSPTGDSVLPRIFERAGDLPAHHAVDGEAIKPGVIYVARPDHHLLLDDGVVHLSRGAKENGHRPAVDTLFRSAAAAHGPRVIGVVLSGTLDDGTAGLLAVRRAGGLTVVQDPDDALYPGMPASALAQAQPHHVARLADLGPLITTLVGPTDALVAGGPPVDERAFPPGDPPHNEASGYSCPDCGGSLWEAEDGDLVRYRCRTGHEFSAESLLAGQAQALDRALWAAFRALEERADVCRRLARRARRNGSQNGVARRFETQAAEAEEQAAAVRRALATSTYVTDPLPSEV
jgi:two-component system chemotaxis response regulator CheB